MSIALAWVLIVVAGAVCYGYLGSMEYRLQRLKLEHENELAKRAFQKQMAEAGFEWREVAREDESSRRSMGWVKARPEEEQ